MSNTVHFHRFADLPVDGGKDAQFLCFGHEWLLTLHPRGNDGSIIDITLQWLGAVITIQYQVVNAFVCDPSFVRNGYFGARVNTIRLDHLSGRKLWAIVCTARYQSRSAWRRLPSHHRVHPKQPLYVHNNSRVVHGRRLCRYHY